MKNKPNWALVGVGGWGLQHLAVLRRLEREGALSLTCACDPTLRRRPELAQELTVSGIRLYDDLRAMLDAEPELRVLTIAAPIPLHDTMLSVCLDYDVFVYLEKPPVPLLAQLDALIARDERQRVGVAFQMVAAPWSRHIKRMLADGQLGDLRAVNLTAAWPRDDAYYQRAAWSGRMTLGADVVFDGPATNGLAHLVQQAMHFAADRQRPFAEPVEIQGELYRARPITGYDTCCMRGQFQSGATFYAAFTHAVRDHVPFQVEVIGSGGWARYEENSPVLRTSGGDIDCQRAPDDVMTDSCRAFADYARGDRQRPPVLLRDTRGYSLATNALLRSSRGINPVPAEHRDGVWHIAGIGEVITQSRHEPLLFSERNLPWAVAGKRVRTENLAQSRQDAKIDLTKKTSRLGVLARDFEPLTFTSPNGGAMPYRLLLPPPSADKKYPVVLFFHGAGNRGDDNFAQLEHCLYKFVEPAVREQFPCCVIAPQCLADRQWVNAYTMNHLTVSARPADAGDEMRLALEILRHVAREHAAAIDPRRLYVAGLSMGGYAVWDCLTRFPEKIAAAVPICGGGDPLTVTPAAARVPVWAFHSSDDIWVDVNATREMVAALRAADGQPRYVEYDSYGHQSWEPAFEEPDLLPWLFAQ